MGLARALAGDPRLMLMDEPFGAIDAITRAGLQTEMLRLQRQLKKTILFVTHDVEEALRLADKIVIMQAGQIVQYDTPFTILTQPASTFVHDLVGADDMVRQLSLLRVESAMADIPVNYYRNGEPTIDAQDDLRAALSLLLRTGVNALTVLHDTRAVGILSLEHIRDSASGRSSV